MNIQNCVLNTHALLHSKSYCNKLNVTIVLKAIFFWLTQMFNWDILIYIDLLKCTKLV